MSLRIRETNWCNDAWRNFNVYSGETLIGTATIRKDVTRMVVTKIRPLWTCPAYDSTYNPADIEGSILSEFRFLPKFG